MGIAGGLKRQVVDLMVERPGRKKDYAAWIAALEASGRAIEARAAKGKYPELTAKVLRHISGIERWGQSRLRVFLGAPFVHDEYDNYRPGEGLTADEQRAFFCSTREETIRLAQQVRAAGLAGTETVLHNSFGPLTARGWLSYLESHAKREAYRIR